MLEDYIERWNEAERLFANRGKNIASMNFKRFYRSMSVATFAYVCILTFVFAHGGYPVGVSDMSLIPVLVVMISFSANTKDKDIYNMPKMRLLCLGGLLYFSCGCQLYRLDGHG